MVLAYSGMILGVEGNRLRSVSLNSTVACDKEVSMADRSLGKNYHWGITL